MVRFRLPLALQCLVFLIPVNIYVIGDWLGTGVQWPLFRFQESYQGSSLILLNREIWYVVTGLIGGKSGISIFLWAIGALLLAIATGLVIFAILRDDPSLIRKGSLATIAGGIILLASMMVQYGVLFNGPAGFAIPVGIPLIFGIGWWMYRTHPAEDPSPSEP